MLIYSIQRQWVPIVVVFYCYCSREVTDGFRYDTPFVRARGSIEGELKAHQCKLKLWELHSFAVKVETSICRLEVICFCHDPSVGVFCASCDCPID